MKRANLYIRVSTDEQADKGYSLRNQEEVLRRYCDSNGIEIGNVYIEDYSAKTFNRPEWRTLIADLKKLKGKSELLLFTKWDRFSRNAPDAYQALRTLTDLGVTAHAIEQPLDLSVPENKMMLAVYLSAPEVENDRRSLNVIYGMRRAMKEGRWMNKTPAGYCNKVSEDGKKYIALKEPEASLMKWAFEELAKGMLVTQEVWRMVVKKGLKVNKNSFWSNIRNPIYCGKIFIPKYKNEDSQLVRGNHDALISDALFFKVQDVLDGRRIGQATKITSHDKLPLRGFLECPKCNNVLTGSASKGRNQHYYYYHCKSPCKYRIKVEDAEKMLVEELQSFMPKPAVMEVFKMVIRDVNKNQSSHLTSEKRQIMVQIEALNIKLNKARELLLNDKIEPEDYKQMKYDIEKSITREEAKLSTSIVAVRNIENILEEATSALSSLDLLYLKGDTLQKREIVGSIFPKKLVFENSEGRTNEANEVVSLIYLINKELEGKKKGTDENLSLLSRSVARRGIEPKA